jgi:hypothetical protein
MSGERAVSEPAARRRRHRRLGLAAGVAGAAVVAATAILAAVGFGGGHGAAAPGGLPPATTKVTTGTLTQTVQVTGTLSYGDPTLLGLIATTDRGTVTWLPAEGSFVRLGHPAYQVDGAPVTLIHGAVPPYRTLAPGESGGDVQELQQSLQELGYHVTVHGDYDGTTTAAVSAWQHDLGLPQTGTVTTDRIVVASGDIRVGLYGLQVGAKLGGADVNQTVYTYSGTTRDVTIALPVDQQQLVSKGIAATVALPGGSTVAGTVSAVGTVASSEIADPGGSAPKPTTTSPPTITVTVSIADQQALGSLTAAPVTVNLVSARHDRVLTVPVTALVALGEGGYGVQVVDGGTVRYVAVKTGLFANGRVEISGAGISAGVTVGVPTS